MGPCDERSQITSAMLHGHILNIAISAADLWYSTANYKPGSLFHKQEVVAQKDSVFFFVSCKQGEELLKTEE